MIKSLTLIHLVLLIFTGAFIYSGTINAPFQYDDYKYIKNNPVVRSPQIIIVGHASTQLERAARKRPVGYISFALNYWLHGLDVRGFRVFNIMLHIINALLLYYNVRLLFRTPRFASTMYAGNAPHLAFLAAVIFVAHPLQTEAVMYLFQRHVLLAAFFCLLTLAAYLLFRIYKPTTKRWLFFILAMVSFTMALASKENAYMFAIVLVVIDFLVVDVRFRERMLSLAPLALGVLFIPFAAGQSFGDYNFLIKNVSNIALGVSGKIGISWSDYFFTQSRVVLAYLRMVVFPLNQNIVHDYPVARSIFSSGVIVALALHSTIILLSIYSAIIYGKRNKLIGLAGFGVLWVYLMLSIESGAVVLPILAAEYRMYLPLAGWAITLSTLIGILYIKLEKKNTKRAFVSVVISMLVLMTVLSSNRSATWNSSVKLWEDAALKSPRHEGVRTELGIAYAEAGQPFKALEQYNKALKINPYFDKARLNRAMLYLDSGIKDKGMKELEFYLKLAPSDREAQNLYRQLRLKSRATDQKAAPQ